jgi:RNA polymerase sigma-70 factor (ECF subfamily)
MSREPIDGVQVLLRVARESLECASDIEAIPEDATLATDLREIVGGSSAALSDLYDSTVARLYSLARAVLHCPQDAEEVVCDVFLFVWRNGHRYDAGRGTVMGWLTMMTRSRSIDRLRQRRSTVSLDDEQAPLSAGWLPVDPECLEKYLDQFEANSDIFRVLALLSPVRRRLIALAFFDGLCHKEIAMATGLPLGSVKSHIRRTLKSMRTMLEIAPNFNAAPG